MDTSDGWGFKVFEIPSPDTEYFIAEYGFSSGVGWGCVVLLLGVRNNKYFGQTRAQSACNNPGRPTSLQRVHFEYLRVPT